MWSCFLYRYLRKDAFTAEPPRVAIKRYLVPAHKIKEREDFRSVLLQEAKIKKLTVSLSVEWVHFAPLPV